MNRKLFGRKWSWPNHSAIPAYSSYNWGIPSNTTLKLVQWGVESNWVHSALRPPIGLLCQPRVIMMMEKLVEWWLAGETEVHGENLPQCRFVHHKPQILCPDANQGRRCGKPATNRLSYGAALKTTLRISGVSAEIRTKHFRNIDLERYRYTNLCDSPPNVPFYSVMI
jgi:hypothetical protein